MLSNENIKGEDLGQEKASGFVTLQYYTRYWLKMNSAGTFSASRITLLLVSVCAQQIKRQEHNRRLREKNQSRLRRHEDSNSQTSTVTALDNSLNMSLYCAQFCVQFEFIFYNKFFYCLFIKIETISRIKNCLKLFCIALN